MQFLLTEAEYNDLKMQKAKEISSCNEELQRLCTLAANYIPVTRSYSDHKTPYPWGCILNEVGNPGYCDLCPVKSICPYPDKDWSK